MSDVLSQSEIDALLNSLSEGGLEAVSSGESETDIQVRGYDFRTANRFSKEHIRTFNIIYETFARLFTTYLSGTLRVMCACEVLSIEELKYQEFVNGMPTPVVLAIISMPPVVGPTMMLLSPDVAYAMISRLLGGGDAQVESSRAFTEIELVLLERIIRQFMGLLVESWAKVVPVRTTLDRIENNPQFAQIVALNEVVAIITLTVRIGTSEGLISFCLPYLGIEPISKQLNTRLWFQGSTDTVRRPAATAEIRGRIQRSPLPLTAVFRDTTVSVRDILGLQVGDVLQLDHLLDQDLIVKVGHLKKFKASLGVKDKRYAIKLTDIMREEELQDE